MAKKDNTEIVEEQPVQDDQPGTPVESISIRDLDQIAQIIDLATQRGAFRGNELSQVGGIYDKLTSFLTAVQEQQDANAEASGEAAGSGTARLEEELYNEKFLLKRALGGLRVFNRVFVFFQLLGYRRIELVIDKQEIRQPKHNASLLASVHVRCGND